MASLKFKSNMLRIAGYVFTGGGAAIFLGLWRGSSDSPLAGSFLQSADGNITAWGMMIAFGMIGLGFLSSMLALILVNLPHWRAMRGRHDDVA